MDDSLEGLNLVVLAKARAYGEARAYEQQLEDQRPLIKEMAIIRIMKRDTCAATRAEKIVESDLEYMEHRVSQRLAIVARFGAEAEYHAAKNAAVQASLTPPSMLELQAENKKYSTMIDNLDSENKELTKKGVALMRGRDDARHETDLKQVALRRANGYLADRIRDVDELTRINSNLSARLEVEPRKVPLTLDTLEQSRESLAAQTYPVEATA